MMGILANDKTRRILTLPGHCLIGRSAACFVRLADRRVSSEHARLQWNGAGWVLRDLSSRNGTAINGRPVQPGEGVSVEAGDVLEFGSEAQSWTMIDDAGPVAAGREPATGRVITARDGLLRFPGSEGPFPYVCALAEGRWILELEDEQRAVSDGEVISVAGRHWTLHLPLAADETELSEDRVRSLAALRWTFAVSADEEFVRVTLVDGPERLELGSRAHHYMLLTLVRQRAEDGEGWIYADELCRMLGLEEKHLNVQIFRAREELGRENVVDAADIIERRRATRQVRVNIVRFEIERV